MHATGTIPFDTPDLLRRLDELDAERLDDLGFGVIGIDDQGVVRRYNRVESALAGLSPQRVLGRPLFTAVAPCMNNALVAHRLDRALAAGEPLDATLDYVLTLRMRPVPVVLRLLHAPGRAMRYVAVRRPD